ncbi:MULTISPECIES: TonB-dependent receptor [Shewanella]|jgi:iron complex outermembrane receptor protein|uniref:TonB-dependent receptor plug domain-containing protein n=1 Tax=Shewanella TaxID=22 RepID=UPI000C6B88E5|nr:MULTISPECIES: TonB-dependent receptor [Shewanella]NCQ45989.1 TonB-dependent receptor [Shewanella frigidimarina]NCO70447.1 TonB-dependent receptor [Shewanella vesiculosa]NCP36481.1 TonB-dependent receptor [Shewanella vesiculosa]NCP69762.1 TonB-dependent receptor [Shewanella vesiculosa]NCP75494.1 TonB-dependent receptor [Shewanella vesiculosa]
MYKSLVCLAVIGSISAPVAIAAEEGENLERIQVIGSRIALRTATDSATPVDIITSEQLEATGITETAKALQFAAPSYSFPFSSITDGSDAVRPASLRGMSPDHTLVLVNGKRRHGSALVHLAGTLGKGSSNVDLNAIPMTAIKRIEILRDGASALYGSDAIAGVINVVLKDSDQGGSITTQVGQTYEGDGEQVRLGVNQGFSFSDEGFVNVSLEAHQKNSTNRAGFDTRQQYPTLADGSPDPREATFDRKNHHVGDSDYDNYGLFLNAEQGLDTKGKLYAFGGISKRNSSSGAFYRRALDSRNVIEVYPDGFLPQISPEIIDYSLVTGYEFELGKWQVDSSAGFGSNSFEYTLENSINASLGPISPTSFDAGTLSTSELNLNVDASSYYDFANDSDLLVAMGVTWRQSGYQIDAGQEESYIKGDYQGKSGGSQGFGGFTKESEVDEDRTNLGLYIELENQLTEDFYWAAAVRYEDYSDFGSNTSWKLSGRYELTDSLALRLTTDTGFRAPSVQQLYFTNVSTFFDPDPVTGEFIPRESGTFNQLSPIRSELGIPDLKAEQSHSYSAGIVYTGNNGFAVTLDAYEINVDDRIILSGAIDKESSPAIAAILEGTNADSARFFMNAVDTKTQGVDLVITQGIDLGEFGDLKANLAYSYKETEIESISLPSILNGLEDELFDNIEVVRMTEANPKNTANIGFTHQYDDFTTNLRFSYFGNYTVGYSSSEVEYGSRWTTDLSTRYRATDNLAVTLGVQNLFDTYPEKRPEDNNFNGIFIYPLTNTPFGFNGGYYYLDLRYTY